MKELLQERPKPEPVKATTSPLHALSRKCACGGSTGASGECDDCRTNRLLGKRAPGWINSSRGSGEAGTAIRKPAQGSRTSRLRLSEPSDACEIEADEVAEKVVSNLGTSAPKSISADIPSSTLHRQADTDAGTVSDAGTTPDAGMAQDAVSADGGSDAGPSPATDQDGGADDDTDDDDITCDDSGCPKMEGHASPGSGATPVNIPKHGGHAMQSSVRTLMESGFGHDFSRVLIHTDSDSALSAKRLRAQAYTIRSDIYFAAGRYAPDNHEGLRLLAHELTHVVQHANHSSTPSTIHRKKAKKEECSGDCASPKAPRHDGCTSGSDAVNAAKFISSILVERAAHLATATWSDSSVTSYACSPSTKSGKGGKTPTPTGDFRIGVKCDSCHTNRKGDGMAWFSGIDGRRIGFHNSQLVGPTHESHGCIRVACGHAKEIHDNTKSGTTAVKVKP